MISSSLHIPLGCYHRISGSKPHRMGPTAIRHALVATMDQHAYTYVPCVIQLSWRRRCRTCQALSAGCSASDLYRINHRQAGTLQLLGVQVHLRQCGGMAPQWHVNTFHDLKKQSVT